MPKCLEENGNELYHYKNEEKTLGQNKNMSGDCSGLSGDCSGLSGDCSEITNEERKERPEISYWVK